MPRIAARNPEISRDRTIYVELISGGVIRITRVVGEMQEGTILPEWSCTGLFSPDPNVAVDELSSYIRSQKNLVLYRRPSDPTGHDLTFMLPAEILGRVDHPWFIRGDVGTSHSVRLRTHESTEQLSSLLRRQVEQAAGGIDERLQEHLSRYANSGSGGEPVAEITVAEVKDLVAWLCEQSPSVSATVADDGLMSLFAKLEGDVRLYVEVDRYGNAEAAISRSPTDVKGIDITTIGELTPELVFGIVGSP